MGPSQYGRGIFPLHVSALCGRLFHWLFARSIRTQKGDSFWFLAHLHRTPCIESDRLALAALPIFRCAHSHRHLYHRFCISVHSAAELVSEKEGTRPRDRDGRDWHGNAGYRSPRTIHYLILGLASSLLPTRGHHCLHRHPPQCRTPAKEPRGDRGISGW